ncbi:hypothetical protein [Sulfitobacter sp.]|uniref:hypothetical protein n=1 Tax=Sulfitobacter sp. TaxID=1903071 RepID=UPI003001E209
MSYHDPKLNNPSRPDQAIGAARNAPKVVGCTIGDHARHAVRIGYNNTETLAYVKAVFPNAKTTPACIGFYRNELRNAGKDVLTSREVDKARITNPVLGRVQHIEQHAHLFEPHELVRILSKTLFRHLSVLETAKRLEAIGQSAFHLSDRAHETQP